MSQNKVHVMVDIETYDVIPSAVILSLGACTIRDSAAGCFYTEFDPNTQSDRTTSASTIEWWKRQGEDKIPNKSTTYLEDGLRKFSFWLSSLRAEPIIWCKGTDFDVAILADAYKYYNMRIPWKYNNIRDMRTLKKCHPQLTYIENPNPHHALQDAIYQTHHLQQIFMYNQHLQWE